MSIWGTVCWYQWPMIVMRLSALLCCTRSPCSPGLRSTDVRSLCAGVWQGHSPHWRGAGVTLCGSNIIDRYLCQVLPLCSAAAPAPMPTGWHFLVLLEGSLQHLASASWSLVLWFSPRYSTFLLLKSGPGPLEWVAAHTPSCSVLWVRAFTYLATSFPGTVDHDEYASIFYTRVVLTLNPLTYSWGTRMFSLPQGKHGKECFPGGPVCISQLLGGIVLKYLFVYV